MGRYYVTGDCHGDFRKIYFFCQHNRTSIEDYMIILGDAGINFWLNRRDDNLKEKLSQLPLSFLMIHGNHEARPYEAAGYQEMMWHGGIVYVESKYPNLLFAKDGEIYDFDGKKGIAIGGAYSVDKEYRIMNGMPWFESEQPTQDMKLYVEKQLKGVSNEVDYVFSHTCPKFIEPTDLFLDFIDQSKVDKSTEEWLQKIYDRLTYEKWYFGHFHANRKTGDMEMLYEEIKELGKEDFIQRLGWPNYLEGDKVVFWFDNGEEKRECYGEIMIVDEWGTLGQDKEVSYSIEGVDSEEPVEKILYKDIPESWIKMKLTCR